MREYNFPTKRDLILVGILTVSSLGAFGHAQEVYTNLPPTPTPYPTITPRPTSELLDHQDRLNSFTGFFPSNPYITPVIPTETPNPITTPGPVLTASRVNCHDIGAYTDRRLNYGC